MLGYQRQKAAAQLQAQQQQVAELLKQSGLEDVTASVGTNALPPPFLAFLVNHLDTAHLVPEEVEQFAAELDSLARCTKGERATDDDSQEDDLQLNPDQLKAHLPCHEEWLSSKTPEEQEALIADLEADNAMLDAQLRDMQELDLNMDHELRVLRTKRQQHESALAHASTTVAAEASSSLQLNADMNQRLEALQQIIKDLQQLVKLDSRKFLLLAADMSPYAVNDKAFVDMLNQYQNSTSGSTSSGPGILAVTAASDPASFLEDNNPWQPSSSSLAGAGDMDQDSMHSELKRLRFVYYLAETQYVAAVAELAGVRAEAEELQRIRREYKATLTTGGPQPWVSEEAREAISRRAADLKQEVHNLLARIRNNEAMQLAALQDVYVLQGDYAAREARNAASVAHKQAMVDALFLQGACHLVLDQLRGAELQKLQGVVQLVQDAGSDVADLITAAKGRITSYESLHAAPPNVAALPSPLQLQGKQQHAGGRAGGVPSPGARAAAGSPHSFGGMYVKYAQRQAVGKDPHLGAMQELVQAAQQHLAPGAGLEAGVGTGNSPALPLPMSARQLADTIEALAREVVGAQEEVAVVQAGRLPDTVAAARGMARGVRGMVYATPAAQAPTMCEPVLEGALTQLEGVISELQTGINEHVNTFTAFTRAMEARKAESVRERAVLKLFYTRPDELHAQLEVLQGQLDALRMTGDS